MFRSMARSSRCGSRDKGEVMGDEDLTMAQAAALAGYTSPTFLHHAARVGRLRTTRHERSGVRLTTRAWLHEYLAGRDMRASSTRRTLPKEGATEWLTIPEAAKRAGYTSASTLYTAAKAGRLRTQTEGVSPYLTTQDWLEEFLAGLRYNTETRGQPAAGRAGARRARKETGHDG
jgi:AraC-like DNA-binding protein